MIHKKDAWLSDMAKKYPFVLSLFLPLSHELRTVSFYRFLHLLFTIISDNSGILNIGYSKDTDTHDLLKAQKSLVRLTVEDFIKAGKWLDVGCGLGGPACLNAQDNSEVTITGININYEQIAEARKRAEKLGLNSRVNFTYGNACSMPLPDNSFNCVYAIETAFHYPDKSAFVREAWRVLHQDGQFAVADIVYDKSKFTPLAPLHIMIGKLIISIPEFFTPDKWRQSLNCAGFKNIDIQDITHQTFGLLHLWADSIKKNREDLLKSYPRFVIDFFEKSLRYFKETKEHGPINYILVKGSK
jgi:cyclopropane fatty-acyl-phospholipid synthase-like methyltransferase